MYCFIKGLRGYIGELNKYGAVYDERDFVIVRSLFDPRPKYFKSPETFPITYIKTYKSSIYVGNNNGEVKVFNAKTHVQIKTFNFVQILKNKKLECPDKRILEIITSNKFKLFRLSSCLVIMDEIGEFNIIEVVAQPSTTIRNNILFILSHELNRSVIEYFDLTIGYTILRIDIKEKHIMAMAIRTSDIGMVYQYQGETYAGIFDKYSSILRHNWHIGNEEAFIFSLNNHYLICEKNSNRIIEISGSGSNITIYSNSIETSRNGWSLQYIDDKIIITHPNGQKVTYPINRLIPDMDDP